MISGPLSYERSIFKTCSPKKSIKSYKFSAISYPV